MLTKKSIVLNGVQDRSKRALMTIESGEDCLSGTVRLYNFGTQPRGIISLGICHNGKVAKAGLTHTGGMLFSFTCSMKDIPENFSCAIVNFLDGEPTPILYGTSEGYTSCEDIFDEVVSSLSQTQNIEEVESVLDQNGIDFDDKLKEEIEENITQCLQNCSDCENCQYKKFYMQSVSTMGEEKIEEEQPPQFYHELKGQIDSLFENNPEEEYLQQIIPNSKWVKVAIDKGEDFYVLGLIYQDEILKYICYGVPGVYQKIPPRELSGFPVWLPLDQEKPQGFGYWLSYQDASNGESVKAIVV